MIKNLPPMGWNSWNTFAERIDEDLILSSAESLISSGLYAAGYEYVVIDDCWALRERDKEGRLVPDPAKFPHGIKHLADALHKMKLKFGMYSCSGLMTCAGYPASYDREYLDARTFARWGVDFLKYDYCFKPDFVDGKNLYRRMGLALANSGRDILFSACSWGADRTREWIGSTGANIWRSTGDIFDVWDSVKSILMQQYEALPYGGVGCFNDMDMLIVGMHGKGHVGVKGMTDEEYRLHFAAWCLLASPLMIGCDIRDLDETTKSILTDPLLLSIQKDPRGVRPYLILFEQNKELPIFVRALANGDLAVGFFNLSESAARMWVTADELGVPLSSGKRLVGTAAYTGEEIAFRNGTLLLELPAHGSKVMRLRLTA